MATRFITASILIIGLVLLMGTKAEARISGQATKQTGCTQELAAVGFCTCPEGGCSIIVAAILNGLGNVTKVPTAYAVTVSITKATIFCFNPATNSLNGNGVPFRGSATLDGLDTIQPG